LLADVYLALTREQISLLNSDEKKNSAKTQEFKRLDVSGLNLKIIHPTPDESKRHDEYLNTLDKSSHGKSAWFNRVNEV
jgi:hypothetical protein